MERFINILILDRDEKIKIGLKEILGGNGNNLLFSNSIQESIPILTKKEIGILLIDIDSNEFNGFETLKTLKDVSVSKNIYILAVTSSPYSGVKMVKGLNEGTIDYITKPFNPNLILSKIEVYKKNYYKDQIFNQLLNTIFPQKVLEDLNKNGKFSPKRVENGVVLFTDFIHFSQKASLVKSIQLLKKLEFYFTQFDEIISRYKLEKIKTIGGSYMIIGGVIEENELPETRACLAALEIRNFMLNEKFVAQSMGLDFWEIRIGIHVGPLVAGIIGSTKFSFDVWGDTVNIASRAEQNSEPNSISITENINKKTNNIFKTKRLGKIEIKKRSGTIEMFILEDLKSEFSLYKEGKIANIELRVICGLSNVDFNNMKKNILNKLKSSLPEEVVYHDLVQTLNVGKAALRIAKLEGLDEEETMLLQTAVLYHDAGYIVNNSENELFAINLAKSNLPKFGYNESQIEIVSDIIKATHHDSIKPSNLLAHIMYDADHYYSGRADYYDVSQKLREENENYGKITINTILKRKKNIRQFGKPARIQELKKTKKLIIN